MAIKNYLDIITSQYRTKPNFIACLSSSLNLVDGCTNVLDSMNREFDIDSAIGIQLDTLGMFVGRKRALNFIPVGADSNIMSDEIYRLVLKCKIAMNMWDGLIDSIYDVWETIFDDIDLRIKDHQDMSMTAYIIGYVNEIRQNLIQNGFVVPKPEGVRINYAALTYVAYKPTLGMKVSTAKTYYVKMAEYIPEPCTMTFNVAMKVSRIVKSETKMEDVF